ncbi:MAG: cyclase family protein [Thermoanaerobaculia bacterium]|jgi:kynurenine formamidase
MKFIDLTHGIKPGMTVFPGTEPPVFEVGSSIETDGFEEKKITMFSHTGTHMDAPGHIIPGARTLDEFPIEKFAGKACVVDVAGVETGKVEVEVLENRAEAIEASDFVILRSGWSERWDSDEYFRDFPVLSPEAARWLVDAKIKGVGIDMISVDEVDSTAFAIHNILLGADLVIIENLTNLEKLPDSVFSFYCFPLRIERADGSPVRAVAGL